MKFRLSEAAPALGAERVGPDVTVSGVATDSRGLAPGALFVALEGERFDGHAFLEQARAAGASAALVRRGAQTTLPRLEVADTRRALGALGAWWRERLALPVLAVTGSNGKTTVKQMLGAALGQAGPVLVTEGNLNNDIGVPLTLLRLTSRHRFAVIELGANHPGEIAYLAGLARPRVGVVTNAAPAHLEGFGDVAGVARAKGELFEALPEDGVAVINADDPYADLWRRRAGRCRQLSFGLQAPADVTARWEPVSGGTRLEVRTPAGATTVRLPLAGQHNVMNALAAAAGTLALGLELGAVREGLERAAHVSGRLQPRRARCGARILDDTYNANPASLAAALEVLAAGSGERWLVLGDMGELGADAETLHREAGRAARAAGVSRLFALGPLAAAASEAFGSGARHYTDAAALAADVHGGLHPEVRVLVKGSRSMHMERVVEALLDGAPAATKEA